MVDTIPSDIGLTYIPYEADAPVLACGRPLPVSYDKIFKGHKVVVVSVPGAFTPTCTADHIPPFLKKWEELQSKGVDYLIVLSANDPFVQSAWGKALGAKSDKILFASDPNAAFSSTLGWTVDLTNVGFGVRTARYALIVDDGRIVYAEKEPESGVTVSGVDAVLAAL